MSSKSIFQIGCVIAALAVCIGAFGAHGLKEILIQNQRTETFEIGVRYHFYHAFAIIILSLVFAHFSSNHAKLILILFLVGIALFSGSLYVLCLTNIRWLGAITPLGGVAFISAWIMMAFLFKK